MRLLISVLLLLMMVISPVMAELDPTQIVITSINNNINVGDYVQVTGQLLYANGSEITVEYMDIVQVGMYVNGEIDHTYTGVPYEVQCDANGYFGIQEKVTKSGVNSVQIVFRERSGLNMASSNSSIYNVNVYDPGAPSNSNTGMIELISYAKGFFALTFFSVLGITLGVGCYSAYANDPQKKADSENSLFALLKISATVTIFYIAVLFLAP